MYYWFLSKYAGKLPYIYTDTHVFKSVEYKSVAAFCMPSVIHYDALWYTCQE